MSHLLARVRGFLRHHGLAGLARAVVRRGVGLLTRPLARARDQRWPTTAGLAPTGPLAVVLPPPASASLEPHAEVIRGVTELFLAHRFDLLGSGWRRVDRQAAEPSGAAWPRWWTVESLRLAGRLSDGYRSIDWAVDPLSGHRWPSGTWHGDVTIPVDTGADIKFPWELGRMQHLPYFAYGFALAQRGATGFHPPERYLREFQDEITDFVAHDPPGFGVSWCSAMDVSVRVASWVVAAGFLRHYGAQFDPAFEQLLGRSVYEHVRFCRSHLAADRAEGNNHYLADLAGIVLGAAALPSTPRTDRWLRRAVRDWEDAVLRQFHPDGSNFEGSIAYHALALECAVWPLLALLAVPASRLPRAGAGGAPVGDACVERIARAIGFLDVVTKPDGTVPLIGDCDSGRLLRLWASYEPRDAAEAIRRYPALAAGGADGMTPYWDENVLDRRAIADAGRALFGRPPDAAASPLAAVGAAVREATGFRARGPQAAAAPVPATTTERWAADLASRYGAPRDVRFAAPDGPDLTEGLGCAVWEGMGVYVWRSPRLYLLVRCGEVGQRGMGGHAHNDQLSLELVLDGADLVRDPGTLTYTRSIADRNRYRCTAAHFTPRADGREQSDWLPGVRGLFRLSRAAPGTCTYAGPDGFVGRHEGFGTPVWRVVRVLPDAIVVLDFGAAQPAVIPALRTAGYGKRLA